MKKDSQHSFNEGLRKRKIPDFDQERNVLIIVDMQKESQPDGFWAGYNWEPTLASAQKVLEACRRKRIPVVHVRVSRDEGGVENHPFDVVDENGRPLYSVRGTWDEEFVDDLTPLPGEHIVNKQRFSAFYQTNLKLILDGLKAEHLIMMGVYTDSCFLTSVYDAFTMGYTISIIKDACTAGTKASHMTSILDMANWIYGSSIYVADEFVKATEGKEHKAWYWDYPNTKPYELDNAEELYHTVGE